MSGCKPWEELVAWGRVAEGVKTHEPPMISTLFSKVGGLVRTASFATATPAIWTVWMVSDEQVERQGETYPMPQFVTTMQLVYRLPARFDETHTSHLKYILVDGFVTIFEL